MDMSNGVDEVVEHIGALVRWESPSDDLDALSGCAELVDDIGAELMGRPAEHIEVGGRSHLRWSWGEGPRRVLVLGHYDTVWPVGSLRDHPWTVSDGVLRGPGCFDMKAGIVQAFYAVAELPVALRDGLTILLTADEEISAPTSRDLIEAEAAGLSAVFVTEPSGPGGALKTARKGMSRYVVKAIGRSAHAGLEPEKGLNTTLELAEQVRRIATYQDPETRTTVTPTVFTSGTTANTVPDSGSVWVDVRSASTDQLAKIRTRLENLVPVTPGIRLEVEGDHRPPLEHTMSRALFERAVAIARAGDLGELTEISAGGVSDGNFTAALGTPTLDGLGAVGAGAHADHEHVVIDAIPQRIALLTGLLRPAP
ncbi:M20 family metallopeptidase [Kribbella solani]|uniref:M20 family metallopeptidase n=1 Tax=Kribbella solani TaxID=236067 RepID=UPI0029A63BFA|nr:M20 family metallopeptidase [Kribbella solani]MDX2968102.1 M20 family metallopeptidase [Kribbella solani]